MSEAIAFYTSPMSRGRMVHWMLEEVGASYEPHLLSLEKGEQRMPEYLAVNPMGKVPAIVHRGTLITEVGAIVTYLADAFPAAQLAPTLDDPKRGAYLRWMFFCSNCCDAAIVDHMTGRAAPTVRPGALSYGSIDTVVKTVEQALGTGPYLLGSRFTAADLYLTAQLGFGFSVKAIEPTPVFQAYLGRTMDRPAYRRFMETTEQWTKDLAARVA
jgi:glutathione S-transferase